MAAPSIASVVATNGSTAAADPTINLPASLASGDLCIVFFSVTQTHGTPSTPAGWTALAVTQGADSSRSGDRDQVLYRWCDGSEGTTLQVNTNGTSVKHTALALRITGADAATNPAISTLAIGTSTQPDPGSVTPPATRDSLFLAWAAIEGTAGAPSTPPTNYTHPSTFTANTTGGGSATNQRQCVAYRQITNTGAAEDPGAWGAWGSSEDWLAFTVAVVAAAAGGTTFTKTLTGSVTPAGALQQQVNRKFAGTVTPAGALVRQTQRKFAGTVTPAGALIRQTQRKFGGTLTPTGALALSKVVLKSLSGSVTPTGALTEQVQRRFGSTTTPTGALVRQTQRRFSGSVTPAGNLVRQTQRRFGGTVTPSGILVMSTVVLRSYGGTVTPTGILRRQTSRHFTGLVTPSGVLLRVPNRRFAGTVTPAGNLIRQSSRVFVGTVTPTGALVNLVQGSPTPAAETVHFSPAIWVAELTQVIPEVGSTFMLWPVTWDALAAEGLVRLGATGWAARMVQVLEVVDDTVVAIDVTDLDLADSKDQGDI